MTGNEPGFDAGNKTGNTSTPASAQQIELTSDEDWKSRVKAEDAALDQKFHAEESAETEPPPQASTATADDQATKRPDAPRADETGSRQPPPRMPEASLATLLVMLSNQAMVALGLIPNPVTRKPEKDLTLARYFIDLIAVLETKTAGNLDRDEAAALDETLHTLRMAFVQRSKETA
jgi:Domain of unknown function (DUF1844)